MSPPSSDDDRRATRPAAAPFRGAFEGSARLVVTAGPDRGRCVEVGPGRHTVGTDAESTLPLTDDAVSRHHLEIEVTPISVNVTDRNSTNGTYFRGARFATLSVTPGAVLHLGASEIQILPSGAGGTTSAHDRFGRLRGASAAMRRVFEALHNVAPTDRTVLIEGETGTGKELAAEALHAASARANGPFVVCDLAALSPAVMEADLFGCVGGVLPGFPNGCEGAFARAAAGTLVLDQVGEMPLDLQPRLLRAIERREAKPIGAIQNVPLDVRIVVIAGPDLSAEVKGGRFRADLYHRIAVVTVRLPALRDRSEDIPLLVEDILQQAGAAEASARLSPNAMLALSAYEWPGNVRELGNVIERVLSLRREQGGRPGGEAETDREFRLDLSTLGLDAILPAAEMPTPRPGERTVGFKEAKERLVEAWEREYLTKLLARAGGNVSLAARRAGIARPHMYKLLRKHGIESVDPGES